MPNLEITRHAQTRFSQRSLSPQDLSLLFKIGSETDEGFMVLQRDYQALERQLKKLLQRVRRMIGKRIVVKRGQVVTGYKCTKGAEKTLLRRSREKGASLC